MYFHLQAQQEYLYVKGNGYDGVFCTGQNFCVGKMSLIVANKFRNAWDQGTNEYVVQLGGNYILNGGLVRKVSGSAGTCSSTVYININTHTQTPYIGCESGFSDSQTNWGASVGCFLQLKAGDRVSIGLAICNHPEFYSLTGFGDTFLSLISV